MATHSTIDLPELDSRIDISVVIVSFNTRDMTIDCLQSLLDHKGALNLQIIVVDNCSSDGSSDALRQKFPQIDVIDSPTNGGFAFGNNIGFEQAVGRYVLLLNPDTRVHAGGLETAVQHMDHNRKVGVVGPKVLLDNGDQQSSMIHFLSLTQLFWIIFIPSLWMRKTSLFGDLRYAGLSRDQANDVDAVSGCFMLARRNVLEQIGGLDQRFFMYGEESEWCFRINKAGWLTRYLPDIEILHYGAASTEHMSEWKSVEMAKGHVLFLRFTRGKFVARIGTLLMVARDLARLPFHGGHALANGFSLTDRGRPWWVRLKFLLRALTKMPDGQDISRPMPSEVARQLKR